MPIALVLAAAAIMACPTLSVHDGDSIRCGAERTAWGEPQEINETETAGTYHAQWVYGEGCYLYVDGNDRVTAIQQ